MADEEFPMEPPIFKDRDYLLAFGFVLELIALLFSNDGADMLAKVLVLVMLGLSFVLLYIMYAMIAALHETFPRE